MEADREELAARLARTMPRDGTADRQPGVNLARFARPTELHYGFLEPCFCVIAQGAKTLTLGEDVIAGAREYLIDGGMVELLKYNGNPIGLELPSFVELTVANTEPGVRGDSSSGTVTKPATLETGLEIRVPLFVKEGEKVRVSTETGEFAGRA